MSGNAQNLAIFDLDNTLIGGDSDYLWGQFLATVGAVDAHHYRQAHDRYYRDYLDGTLDIFAFLRFQLAPLASHPLTRLLEWRDRFIREIIRPVLLPKAFAVLDQHRARGEMLLIITATNRFITEPIAALLGVTELIATEPEMGTGGFTGEVLGTPSYADGKVTRLDQWLAEKALVLGESSFYSDSHNDLPLLRRVTHPVAVDPDALLHAEALRLGWPIISLR